MNKYLPSTLYSSPLERALQTGEIAMDQDRQAFTLDDRLKERGFGPQYEGKPYDRNSISKLVQMTEEECIKAGIESENQVRERCASFLNHLRSSNFSR